MIIEIEVEDLHRIIAVAVRLAAPGIADIADMVIRILCDDDSPMSKECKWNLREMD